MRKEMNSGWALKDGQDWEEQERIEDLQGGVRNVAGRFRSYMGLEKHS